MDMKYTKEMS